MQDSFSELGSRALLKLHGADAETFLQGLVTNDILGLQPHQLRLAALLSPQGKYLFDFLVGAVEPQSLILDAEAARLPDLIARLKLYKLRAAVAFERLEDWAVFSIWPGARLSPAVQAAICAPDPRHAALGFRLIGPRESLRQALAAAGLTERPEQDYRRHRHSLGIAEGAADLGIERVFILEANFEELHGVDFKKGCYVGQELTARMKHKTQLRKRVLPVAAEKGTLAPGAAILAGETDLGIIVGGEGEIGFALVRLDRLAEAEAAGTPLTADGIPHKIGKPAFLNAVFQKSASGSSDD